MTDHLDPASEPAGPSLSVALCTFQGTSFLDEQLQSLVAQTRAPLEVVACDDGSTDGTADRLDAFARTAPFPVHVVRNPERLGFVANFEQAAARCSGEVILLCDQDDVWEPDKLQAVADAFGADPALGAAFSDAELIDASGARLGRRLWDAVEFTPAKRARFARGDALDILREGDVVTGATLAFRARYRDLVLPIPGGVVHDGWIAILIAMVGTLRMLSEPLVRYRLHDRQQIGVPRARLDASGLLAELSRRTTKDERAAFAKVAEQFATVAERVEQRAAAFPPRPGAVKTIRAKADHFQARARVGSGRGRLGVVLRELASGRYHRFSSGWPSAAKDLLRTERMGRR